MKKILVIGGECQGKTEWVQRQFKEYTNISAERLLKDNRSGKVVSGACINKFHLIMKQWIKDGRDYKEELAFIRNNPSWLIIANEVGSGIVPMDKSDRIWREEVGRALCELAKEADEVYRVYCGIPTMIKGGDYSCYTHSMRA